MKIAFMVLLLAHGLIHLLGFVKAFELADVSQLTRSIPRAAGIRWLLTAILFLLALLLLVLGVDSWWVPGLLAVVFSQFLIIQHWADAKFGSIANVMLLFPIVASLMNSLPSSFQHRYEAEVRMRVSAVPETALLTYEDIAHLPDPVRRYLQFVGAVGKPKIHNFRAAFRGSMKRSLEAEWMDIASQQYNFFDDPARLFHIESSVYGIPLDGLHMYVGDSAVMEIKVASLFQVVDARGEEMNRSETVTLFNDMCLLAPATLIDRSIQWETIDPLAVKATFTNRGSTITASLSFSKSGELVNFISHDRYYSEDGRSYTQYPWSTPVRDYRDFDGRKLPAYGEAVWHTPEGEFPYARFSLVEIEYNCTEFRR